jgi:hypothetical protein
MRALVWIIGVWVLVLGMPARADSAPSAWGVGAMEKVRPQTEPGHGARVQLFAARNEFVSFQVGLHGGDSGWSGVSARLTTLEGPGLIVIGAEIPDSVTTYLREHPAPPPRDVLQPVLPEQ